MPQEYEVPSESNPDVMYTVTIYDDDILEPEWASCTCMAWMRSSLPMKERVCKHIESLTGEMRKGDAGLTEAEASWVLRNFLGGTPERFRTAINAVRQSINNDTEATPYDKELAANVIEYLEEWSDNEVPGPDAQRALTIITRAIQKNH